MLGSPYGCQDKKQNSWKYYRWRTHLWFDGVHCRHFFERTLAFLHRHDFWFCYRWVWLFMVAYESKKKKVSPSIITFPIEKFELHVTHLGGSMSASPRGYC